MGDRYLGVHAKAKRARPWKRGERTAHQRSLAERDLKNVAALASVFGQSVDRFTDYRPRKNEPFYPPRDPDALKRWRGPGKPNTSRLAARIEKQGVRTGGKLPSLSYIGRELVPSRTTSPSRFEKSLGTKLRLDLLFSNRGQPVVAEVKAVSDENVYYALIQGLAVCAQLAPGAQRKRLSGEYELAKTGPLELWIVLASHNSRGEDKAAMVNLARDIAEGLLLEKPVASVLSRIACVEAEIPPRGPVQLSERWTRGSSSSG